MIKDGTSPGEGAPPGPKDLERIGDRNRREQDRLGQQRVAKENAILDRHIAEEEAKYQQGFPVAGHDGRGRER